MIRQETYRTKLFLMSAFFVLCCRTLSAQPCQGLIWSEDFGSGASELGNPSPNVNPIYNFENFGVQPGNYTIVNYFDFYSSWHVVPEDHTPGDTDGYFMVIDGLGSSGAFYSVQINNLLPNTDYAFSGWALNMDLPQFQSNLTFVFMICDLNGNELANTTTSAIPATDMPIWTNHQLSFNSGTNTSVILKVFFTATGYDDFAFDDFQLNQLGVSAINNIDLSLCPGESLVVNGITFDENNPGGSVTLPGASYQGCDSIVNVNLNFSSPVNNIIQPLCIGESIVINGTTYDANHPTGTEILPNASSTGCDSTIHVFLTFFSPSSSQLNMTLCEDESILVNGTVFDASNPGGVVTIPNGNVHGCDSTVTVNLTFNPNVVATISGGTSICQGDSVLLTIGINGAGAFLSDIVISNGVAAPQTFSGVSDGFTFWVSPTATSTYTITNMVTQGNICTNFSGPGTTVLVTAIEPGITASDFNGFGVSCAGFSDGTIDVAVSGGVVPYSYHWNTGETQANLSGLSAGTYAVTVTDTQGCSTATSVELTEPSPMVLTAQITPPLCYGEASGSIVLDDPGYPVPLQYFSWQNGIQSPVDGFPIVISALESGVYLVSVIDENACEAQLDVMIPSPGENSISLGDDVTISLGDSILLTAIPNFSPDTVAWNPVASLNFQDDLKAYATPFETTIYTVTASDSNGCQVSDQLMVRVDKTKQIFVPNVFSPNGDGVNDIVYVFAKASQIAHIKVFRIYGRWGTLLFEKSNFQPNDPGIGWDGHFRGSPMNSEVLTWYMEVAYIDGFEEVLKGDITLIR